MKLKRDKSERSGDMSGAEYKKLGRINNHHKKTPFEFERGFACNKD